MLYRFFYSLFLVILKSFFRLRIVRKGSIPEKGPAILVANHSSFLDPPIITCCTRRIIHWMVTEWVYQNRLLSLLVKNLPFLKVEHKKANKEPLEKAVKFLNQGEIVGIFPEGKISGNGELDSLAPGAVYLSSKTKAPIIPVYIKGAYEALSIRRRLPRFFKKVYAVIGESIFINEDCLNKDKLKKYNLLIREKIKHLEKHFQFIKK